MRKLKFKLLVLSLAIAMVPVLAATVREDSFGEKSLEEFSKTWEGTFEVNPDALLDIKNKYGKVHITTWEKNTIVIKVVIKVDVESKTRAESLLNDIEIFSDANKTRVKVLTTIQHDFPDKLNKKLAIDYEVQMPLSNNLVLHNKFGDVYINALNGKADLDVAYGTLECGVLGSDNNVIDLAYSTGTVEDFNSGQIKIKYSEITVDKGADINIESKYSRIKLKRLSNTKIESQYDQINIKLADNIDIEGKFSHSNIRTVKNSLVLICDYGSCNVDNIKNGFDKIYVKSQFAGIDLNFEEGSSYQLEAEASLGNIDFPERKSTVSENTREHTSQTVKALVGNDKNTKSTVTIDSRFGGVSLDYNL